MTNDRSNHRSGETDGQLSRLMKFIPGVETPKDLNDTIMGRIKASEAQKEIRKRSHSLIFTYIASGTAVLLALGIFVFAILFILNRFGISLNVNTGDISGTLSDFVSLWQLSEIAPLIKLLLPLALGVFGLLVGDIYFRKWYNKRHPDNMVS